MTAAIQSPVMWPPPHQTGYRHGHNSSHDLGWNDQQLHYQPPGLMQSYTQSMHSMPTPSMTTGPVTSLTHQGAVRAPQPHQCVPWTTRDDDILMESKSSGMGWNEIHKQYFPGKSGNACRKRHERLMVKRRTTEWDEQRIRRLINEYNAAGVREGLWRGLSERIGERWEDVEKVCFQQGLRGLRTSRQRHDRTRSRASSGFANSEIDRESPLDDANDSGILMENASAPYMNRSIHSPVHPPAAGHSFDQILQNVSPHDEYGYP